MPPILSTLKSHHTHDDDDDNNNDDSSASSSCSSLSPSSVAAATATSPVVEDDPSDPNKSRPQQQQQQQQSRKLRSPRKKSKKGGRQRPSTNVAHDIPPQTTNQPRCVKEVRFGSVTIRYHARCMGTHVVPYDGAWPLGISDDCLGEVVLSLEGHEVERQERLQDRWAALLRPDNEPGIQKRPETTRSNSGSGSGSNNGVESGWDAMIRHGSASLASLWSNLAGDDVTARKTIPPVLESRQWDYKQTKNPIFGPLPEQGRMRLLLEDGGGAGPGDGSTDGTASGASQPTGGTDPHPPPFRKVRSRSRSSSFSDSQHFTDAYPRGDVHHIRTELEQIRVHRGQLGCDCRKLQVYVPPSDGSGGKKAQKRRLSLKKVQDELRKRHLLPSHPVSREDLERLLLRAIESEPCCQSDSCPCAQNDIECQDNACACWKRSHQGQSRQQTGGEDADAVVEVSSVTAPSLNVRCGNPMGIVTVNWDQIDNVRNLYCREIKV